MSRAALVGEPAEDLRRVGEAKREARVDVGPASWARAESQELPLVRVQGQGAERLGDVRLAHAVARDPVVNGADAAGLELLARVSVDRCLASAA